MKRTLIPKALALILSASCWALWPASQAMIASLAILSLVLVALSIPVFLPRSNFYVQTLSSGARNSDRVALTFDDGPDPRYTPQILDYLDREGIRAAFFVVGSRVEAHPELLREIVARGHILGNHSYRHRLNFHFGSARAFRRDFDAFDAAMAEASGLKCRLFRAPQGFRTPLLADVLRQRELVCIGWQARGFDTVRSNSASILESILKNLSGGDIVLLHDGGGLGGSEERAATLETLPELVREVRARGLRFERLDLMLEIDPYLRTPIGRDYPSSSAGSSVQA